MDLRSGCPFWQVRSGLLGVYPVLEENIECDAAVIGGGLTGALVAHHLVDAGLATVLLDKRDFGWGSTSASTALLQYDLDTPLADLAETLGEARAAACYRAAFGAVQRVAQLAESLPDGCGIARRPSVYLASSRRHRRAIEREYVARSRHGFQVELWDRAQISARFPFERAAALFAPGAAEIDPYRFTHALITRSAARGLRAHDRTEVAELDLSAPGRPGRPVRLTTDRGCRVAARSVVFATGYETQARLRQRTVKLHSTYALASEPVGSFPGWYERSLIWESARPYRYLRTTDDGRVIVGGEDDAFVNAGRRDRALGGKAKKLARSFTQMFPDIPFEPGFCWAGTFADTDDGLPYIGRHPDYPNAWFAAAYGGNGIPFGLLAAEIIRDGEMGDHHAAAELFGFDRTSQP